MSRFARAIRLWVLWTLGAGGLGAQGTPTPQFDPIPSQGSGVILSDPTFPTTDGNGNAASFGAIRPIDLRGNGRPDLFTGYGIYPPLPPPEHAVPGLPSAA